MDTDADSEPSQKTNAYSISQKTNPYSSSKETDTNATALSMASAHTDTDADWIIETGNGKTGSDLNSESLREPKRI